MAAGGVTARLEAGPRYDWLLLMTSMALTAAVAMRLLADNTAERQPVTAVIRLRICSIRRVRSSCPSISKGN